MIQTNAATDGAPGAETHVFQAEVSRLLEIVAKSLYSQKEVFLRELISNASDACDRHRHAALTDPALAADKDGAEDGYRIVLRPDEAARTLTVSDNGIGMSRSDLIDNLGTIARSGTLAFMNTLSGDARKDTALIGQFGVGFYSAFMVADTVEVSSRRAGESQGHRWVSDGKGAFTVDEAPDVPRGTIVVLHLAADETEFLQPDRLRHIVKSYSDHVAVPIVLAGETDEQINRASALWTRPKAEISADDYKEFYHHVAHAFDDPWATLHYRAEGVLEYTALLYVPGTQPFDLYAPERKHHVKLYVRRVFVGDGADGLVPPYLRFLRGIIDSEDLPLNISREMLQNNPLVTKIRQGVTKRLLAELGRKAAAEDGDYDTFWQQFGPVLKEGLYEALEHRDALLNLTRFRSTEAEGWVGLDSYIERMKPGQDSIFYVNGNDEAALRQSPQLEGFRARGVEVLLMTDPVDEFWVPAVGQFKDKPFKSVTRGTADLSKIEPIGGAEAAKDETKDKAAAETDTVDALIGRMRDALRDEVKDVRASERLTESAVCLVADEGDLDLHLERLLKQHKQLDRTSRRVLEVNPTHPLIRRLAAVAGGKDGGDQVRDAALLMLDQARIVEGEPIPDPAAFARRLAQALERGLVS
ncbi:MAG: molecular chaperone HtpG [Inquilinaceae bacterium]